MSVYTGLHQKYGNPHKVAEFRLFLLNDCYKSCESCFYKRSDNKIQNVGNILSLAKELKELDYQLETCYLLPTDFFENPENFKLVQTAEVQEILSMFLYTGIASTLEGDLDFSILPVLVEKTGIRQIELQINLIVEKLSNPNYSLELENNIKSLKELMGESIVFNLALNLGKPLSQTELDLIEDYVNHLSDDGILEINFTFLYNEKLNWDMKQQKLKHSLFDMKKVSRMYNKEESLYNDRTIMRKPAFVFMEDEAYIPAIIPFDEYVFVKDERFKLPQINFEGFLSTLSELEKMNKPIIEECLSCSHVETCMGKNYWAAANYFNLPCFLEENYGQSR